MEVIIHDGDIERDSKGIPGGQVLRGHLCR